MWLPVVIRPVRFSAPVAGAELIGLVEQQALRPALCQGADGRFQVGQRSAYPFANLRVSPSIAERAVDAEASYDSCVVVTHVWGSLAYPVRYDMEPDDREVTAFARGLETATAAAGASVTQTCLDPNHACRQPVVEEPSAWSLRTMWTHLRQPGATAQVPAPRTSPEAAEAATTR